ELVPRSYREAAAHVLGHDALAPTLAAMTQPDLVQRVLPQRLVGLPFLPDRGRALEGGWETAWRSEMGGDDRFARGFLDVLRPRDDWVPALFLNATAVETGNRVVTSNLDFTRDRLPDSRTPMITDTLDLLAALDGDVPFSTAVHDSARFAYVSPAGTLRRGAGPLQEASYLACAPNAPCEHVIDGGYFENSGVVTAMDVAAAIRRVRDVPIHVLVIRYRDAGARPPEPYRWFDETLSPVWGIFNTRSARGTLAVMQLARDTDDAQVTFELVHRPHTAEFPLGWLLSAHTRRRIDRQMGPDSAENGTAMTRVAALLGTTVRSDRFYEDAVRDGDAADAPGGGAP
ncbi:MAG TPA: hypothetical protein VFW74_00515, partial [Acidimicrobiia bacterium]|nr:hypothetical protein [Acidimicrobiia bacterium]